MLDVCLLGCGGMMPLPYRWLTSLMVRFNGSSLLIDCGEGTQVAIREKGWSFKPIDTICFTHYHGDHIGGLPGLLLTMGNSDRTEPLTLIGPPGLEKVVNALRIIAPGLPFPIIFKEITEPVQTFELNGYRLKAFKVNHNVTCYGYTMEIDRAGKFDAERARGAEIPLKYWSKLQKGEVITEDAVTYTPDMVMGPARKGIKLTYCTDTRPTESLVENAKNQTYSFAKECMEIWKRFRMQKVKTYDVPGSCKNCGTGRSKGTLADTLQSVASKTGILYGGST